MKSDIPVRCREEKMEAVLEDIKDSKNCIAVIEHNNGGADLLLTGLNENTLGSFVVLMCKFKQLYQFLKLAVIITERLQKNNKKGMVTYNEAVKFCEENFCDVAAKEEE